MRGDLLPLLRVFCAFSHKSCHVFKGTATSSQLLSQAVLHAQGNCYLPVPSLTSCAACSRELSPPGLERKMTQVSLLVAYSREALSGSPCQIPLCLSAEHTSAEIREFSEILVITSLLTQVSGHFIVKKRE